MYKQISARYFESEVGCSHKSIDSAMQYCLDAVNAEKGVIIDIKVTSFTDASLRPFGTVVIVYKPTSESAPSTNRFAGSLASTFK